MSEENMASDDYIKNYKSFWKDIVENPDGSINKDQVMRELSDYGVLLENTAKVYSYITHNRISKQNTLPEVVISVADDLINDELNKHIEHKEKLISMLTDFIYVFDNNLDIQSGSSLHRCAEELLAEIKADEE